MLSPLQNLKDMIRYYRNIEKLIKGKGGTTVKEENKTARIFLACACGAGTGSLAALQLGYFWGLGALLGGLVGYLIYDLEQVAR